MSRKKGSIPWNKGIKGYKFSKNKRLNDLNLKSLSFEIKKGLSKGELEKRFKVSEPTIYKYVNQLHISYKKLLYKNGRRKIKEAQQTDKFKEKLSKALKGRNNYWLKGKTYEEIFGCKKKAKARSKITSDWMKTKKNIRKYCKSPSKPQIALYEKVKEIYLDAELEYPITISKTKTIWLDIAIPRLKLNYEYDGNYWHQDKNKDIKRDKILKKLGWKIIRIKEGDDLNKSLKG